MTQTRLREARLCPQGVGARLIKRSKRGKKITGRFFQVALARQNFAGDQIASRQSTVKERSRLLLGARLCEESEAEGRGRGTNASELFGCELVECAREKLKRFSRSVVAREHPRGTQTPRRVLSCGRCRDREGDVQQGFDLFAREAAWPEQDRYAALL
jgi:hypothetical protein